MKFTFKTNIDKKEYDNFVVDFPSTTFMQVSSWGDVKTSWKSDLVGLYCDDSLVAVAQILKRKLFLKKYLFYVPRGYVIDYTDKKILKEFTEHVRNYAKKNGAIVVKIDPYICFNEDNIQKIKKGKDVKTRGILTKDTKKIDENLKSLGYVHGGFNKKVNSYIQPRYTMAISLKDENGKEYTKEELRYTFPKNTRNYIGKYHGERGVYFTHSKNINDIKYLVDVLKRTEDRQHVSLRSEDYFKKIMENYPDNAVIFMAHVNVDKYINFLKRDMIENESKKEFNEKQIEEAIEVKKKYGNNPLAGATIVLMPTCKKGLKVATFLYAGTNTEIFPSLKITNGLMFYRLCFALENNLDYCDLGGVDGSLEDHLSVFKSKFNPFVFELVGEYNLIISKFFYKAFNMAMDILRFIRSKR